MNDNTRGALLMMAAMLAFTLNDTFVKAIGVSVPLFQMLFIRGIFASAMITGLAWYMGALKFRLPKRDWVLIIVRCISEIGAAYYFITALYHLKFANVSAIMQMLPLTVTLGGALFFRERIGWRRLLAIAIGFYGMILIVNPGAEDFNSYTIYAIVSVLFVTVRDLATRRISKAVPSMFVTLSAAVSVMAFSGVAMFAEARVAPSLWEWQLIVMAAVCILFGYVFSVSSMRIGELAVVTPFRYTGLLWAALIGFVIFAEVPTLQTLIGAAIIAATGIFTLYREAQVKRAAKLQG